MPIVENNNANYQVVLDDNSEAQQKVIFPDENCPLFGYEKFKLPPKELFQEGEKDSGFFPRGHKRPFGEFPLIEISFPKSEF